MRTLQGLFLAAVVVLSMSSPALASYKDLVLSDTPEAYWRLGETSGNVAYDSSGHGHHATYSGPTVAQPGAITGDANTSMFFDSSDLIQDDSTALMPSLDSWSVEAWVKVPATGKFMAVTSWYPGGYLWGHNGRYLLAITEQGLPSYDVRDVNANGITAIGSTPITDSAWHHLVGVLDRQGGKVKLYVDGKLVASSPIVVMGLIWDPGIALNMGGQYRYFASSWQFSGMMDELAIYRGALSADRVRAHNDAGRGLDTDADGDTVPDALDKCADTPVGSVVDSIGCIAFCPAQASQADIDAAVQSAVTACSATVEEKDQTIASLNADVNLLLAAAATKDQSIASLQSQVSALDASLSQLQQRIDALNARIGEMYTQQQLDQAVLAAQQAVASTIGSSLGDIFGASDIVLPGGTVTEQISSLTSAIGNMPDGQIRKLQDLLTQ